MGARNLEAYRRATSRARAQEASRELDFDGLLEVMLTKPPLPTQRKFIYSPTRNKAYMGPFGCAKTSTLCASGLLASLYYPGSRWLVTRAVQWTLEETTMRTFREMVARLGPGAELDFEKDPIKKLWLAPARQSPDGEPLPPSEIVFHAIDEIEKLGSTSYTGILIDEMSEVAREIVHTLRGRLRQTRYDGGQGPYFLLGAFNPTTRAHWLYQELSGEHGCPEPWAELFRPNPRENAENLPDGYYEAQAKGMSPEMKVRLIGGEWGPDPRGLAVFREEFRALLHVSELKPIAGLPIIRSWDFGRRRPAVVWAQLTPEGWLNYLLEELGQNSPLREFAQHILRISQMKFPMAGSWRDFADPHGEAKRDDGKTSFNVLRELGIQPRGRDVAVEKGLELMSKDLNTLIRGRPRAMFDRTGCPLLIEGYGGGYIYPPPRPGSASKEKPFADGFYEHLMDCSRYAVVNLTLGSTVREEDRPDTIRRVRHSLTGY